MLYDSSILADIKLEIQSGEDGTSEDVIPSSLPSHVYHPKHALMKALNDWIAEFSRQKTVSFHRQVFQLCQTTHNGDQSPLGGNTSPWYKASTFESNSNFMKTKNKQPF